MKQSTNRSTKQPINNAPTRTTNLPTNPPTKPTNGPTNGPAIRPKQPTNPFIHPLTQPIHPPINQSTNAIHKPTKPNQRTQPPSLQMRVQVTRQRDRRKQTNYSRGGLHHNNQPFNLPTNRPTNQPTNQSNQPPNQKPIQPTNQPSNQPINQPIKATNQSKTNPTNRATNQSNQPTDQIGCLRRMCLVGLGFLQSVSYIESILTHEKLFAVGKSGPNATNNLYLISGWVGLGLGSSSVSQ